METGHSSPLLVSLLLIATGGTTQGQVREQRRILTCLSTFHPNTNHDELVARFGAANVMTGSVYLGEGRYEEGTVLFADTPEDKLEILWKDRDSKRFLRRVVIRGEKSRWHTRKGLTLGMDLHTIEKLNRRPFRLLGLGWDYEGTVMSWSGGRLEQSGSAPCTVQARLAVNLLTGQSDYRLFRQVAGDREFSSGHPAMQALNPRVYKLWLQFR